MTLQEVEKPDISELALICRNLFSKYATSNPARSTPRKSAARQQERFAKWESNLADFTGPNSSPGYDEIRDLVINQLSMIQTNLEFEFPDTLGILSSPEETQRREWILQLEGTPSEALNAVEATIGRLLNELREALDHEIQAEDHTEPGTEESDFMSIKRVAQCNPSTASTSLQNHGSPRQRTKQRQQPTRTQQTTNHAEASARTERSRRGSNSSESQSNRQSGRDMCLDTPRPLSSFNPTSHLGSSIASSSQSSTRAMFDQDAPSLNFNSDNPSNTERVSTLGLDRSFDEDEPEAPEAIVMPERSRSVTANQMGDSDDMPTDAPDVIRISVSEGEVGGSAGKVINKPNETSPLATFENRMGSKQLLPRADTTLELAQKSPDSEALGMGSALNRRNDPSTLPTMGHLENCMSLQGASAAAETVHHKTTQPCSRPLSSGRPQSLSSIVEIAKNFFHQGKYLESEEEYRKALKLEASGPCVISIKGNLANALAKQGKHQEAEDTYREILAFSTETLGERHPHRLACRSNLATMLEYKGEFAEAEEIYRSVWKLHGETLGNSHPDTMSSYNRLANSLTRLKKFGEATLIYEEALEARRKLLGEEHPDTIITLGNLANSLRNQGQCSEAEARYMDAMKVGMKVLEDDHPHLQWIRARLQELVRDGEGW
ncbi:hypothetical protein N0V84_002044 [Fusarium piperis]|uniref:Kinesin light chain n=1 Tax=Fusarium piperis TaxID=1435070 RepID=A0A9W8WK24_9HYPO|nr:hypothetical protein N0V84_002044 [Fusarium piperis]